MVFEASLHGSKERGGVGDGFGRESYALPSLRGLKKRGGLGGGAASPHLQTNMLERCVWRGFR